MTYAVTITNKNGLKYRFFKAEVPNLAYRSNSKLLKQSLPDAEAEDAIIINLGKDKTVSFPFKITKTPTEDASVSTSTAKNTVQEKFDYLDQTFVTSGIEDLYTVEILSNGITLTKTGTLENLNFNFTAENPSYLVGDITIAIGGGNQ